MGVMLKEVGFKLGSDLDQLKGWLDWVGLNKKRVKENVGSVASGRIHVGPTSIPNHNGCCTVQWYYWFFSGIDARAMRQCSGSVSNTYRRQKKLLDDGDDEGVAMARTERWRDLDGVNGDHSNAVRGCSPMKRDDNNGSLSSAIWMR
ncbi:hypothetical protein F0562_001459 [Nyssa sinensis]|uniref:Uncharacterized protein n=1 Tax=Nyssa sinensis TaxID=561372 RepID=A0A5J5C294_9ASTE|nr:hypothetical protein F0562_001459 [Nyssa sinensis]